MINLSYNFSPTLKNSLEKIENLRRQILTFPLSPKNELRLRWEATVQRVYWSLNLAGNALTKRDIIKLLALQSKKRLISQEEEVLNYKKALDYISQNWLVSRKEITLSTIFTLYEIACKQTLGRNIVNLFRLNDEPLRNILEYIKSGSEHPVIQAGISQIQLVHLSPFVDGNGRLARLLAYLILYKSGYDFRGLLVLDEYWGKDKASLKDYTQKAIKAQNLTIWLEYFTQAMVSQLEKAGKDITHLSFSSDLPAAFWELNDRQKSILTFLEPPDISVTNRKIQKMFKVSQITASRDLARLTSLGLLYSHGKGRSVYYTRV